MRTNARPFPALAAALLLAASAATVSCCCAGKVADGPKELTSNTAVVIVSYDPETRKARMSISDKTLELREHPKDIVKWISAYGTVHIAPDSWKPKLPFSNHPAPDPDDKRVLRGGPPSPGSHVITPDGNCKDREAQCYEYTAWLWLWSDPDGHTPVKIDPRIVIMP